MAKYRNKNNKKHLGLLNYEGDVFRVYKVEEDYLIVDDKNEIIKYCSDRDVLEIYEGNSPITTSYGKTYLISDCHQDAKPPKDEVINFLKMNNPIEDWRELEYRIREEGIEYAVLHYSDWSNIKDDEFHSIRETLIDSIHQMKDYVNKKIKQLNGE